MVAPLIAAAGISGLASIGSALLGSSAQKKALRLQAEEAARQNLIDQKQLALAERMIDLGLATQIDAQGNVTTYDEATNTWKVIPSEKQAQLQAASDDELLRQLNIDAPMARGEALRNSAMRGREASVADGQLADIQSTLAGRGRVDPNAVGSQLRMARQQAVNTGFDEVGRALSTMNLRSGATGAGQAAQLGRARAQALAQTMGVPDLEGLQFAEGINASRLADKINNYGAIASRASNAQGFSFSPSSVAPSLANALQSARQGATGAFGTATSGINAAGQPNQVPGVYNPAPLVGAIGDTAANLFTAIMGSKQQDKYNNYKSRAVTGNDWQTQITEPF